MNWSDDSNLIWFVIAVTETMHIKKIKAHVGLLVLSINFVIVFVHLHCNKL